MQPLRLHLGKFDDDSDGVLVVELRMAKGDYRDQCDTTMSVSDLN